MGFLRLDHKKDGSLPSSLAHSLSCLSLGNPVTSRLDTQIALWKGPHGEELRPPASNQYQLASQLQLSFNKSGVPEPHEKT